MTDSERIAELEERVRRQSEIIAYLKRRHAPIAKDLVRNIRPPTHLPISNAWP